MEAGEREEEEEEYINGSGLPEARLDNGMTVEPTQCDGLAQPDQVSTEADNLQSSAALAMEDKEKTKSFSAEREHSLQGSVNKGNLDLSPSDEARENDGNAETEKAIELPKEQSSYGCPSEKAEGLSTNGSRSEVRHSFELIYGIMMSRNVFVMPQLWKQNSKAVQMWYKVSSPCHKAIMVETSSPGGIVNQSALNQVPVKELNRCENAWKPRWKQTEQECLAEDKGVELVKRTRTLMNKLTAKTLPLLTPEMGKILTECNSGDILTMVITIIHNKAVDELLLAPIYGEMCAMLLGKIFQLRNQVRRAEERKERERARALGNAFFVGHLFNVGILNIKLTLRCIVKVIFLQTDHGVDLAVKLIKAVGFKLWREANSEEKKLINSVFERVKQLSTDAKLTSRTPKEAIPMHQEFLILTYRQHHTLSADNHGMMPRTAWRRRCPPCGARDAALSRPRLAGEVASMMRDPASGYRPTSRSPQNGPKFVYIRLRELGCQRVSPSISP
ncbi:Eukaryotic initiation factor 4F subunit p150 (EIF 4F p150) (EIF-4F p150) (MRNA cap-binding protein complex su bunit p150) [Trichuris trichiura]|uniref:Eukaryotic initiation factor 4F subunit p150 (EIF 4F p150) (EIF-4F p150) (MRNA cap-binding protein complex su bunit p150) n=1 Tax=Trichuris trichiura TaxID=36087 RepID=A0A077Z1F1_TRITR|nr:Eukaryotic initiation factor 4F subunit p150 (EIF 4F p150) (EIF-4F p150) (MRNA cap-binding protein complex su bunit p150) [Trichuris trichiura]